MMAPLFRLLIAAVSVVGMGGAGLGGAWAQAPGGVCATGIAAAAARHGVPHDLMLAIGTVESGLRPWVINAEGQGYGFDSAGEAIAAVEALRAAGIESIDVGCMQINLYWHPDAFDTLAAAFSPALNADYAARFLDRLHDDVGSWTLAAMRYHSGDPQRQQRYGCAVQLQLASLRGEPRRPCLADGPTLRTAATTFSGPAVLTPRPLASGRSIVITPGGSDGSPGAGIIHGTRTDSRVIGGQR